MAQKLSLLEKLYAEKEFVDVKIHCDEKIFECHKGVPIDQGLPIKTSPKLQHIQKPRQTIHI